MTLEDNENALVERKELERVVRKTLLLLPEDSGTGFGICSVANSFAWEMMRPRDF